MYQIYELFEQFFFPVTAIDLLFRKVTLNLVVGVEKENPAVFRPVHELKGFCKVFLQPGETREVEIPFENRTFKYFNAQTGNWETEEGNYKIMIAKNSRETVLQGEIYRKGTGAENPYKELSDVYQTGHIEKIADEAYEKLLGHRIPDGTWKGELEKNDGFLCCL